MAKPKKDGQFLNCYLKRELWEKVAKYSEETMIPKTSIVERALEEYFNRIEKETSK